MEALVNHLWQSTAFVMGDARLCFRRSLRNKIRYSRQVPNGALCAGRRV